MKRHFFDHLLTLARQAFPGHNQHGVDLGTIIVQGYSRELTEDLKGLVRLPVRRPTMAMCLQIEAYIQHYEGYLRCWLLLLAMPYVASFCPDYVPIDAEVYPGRIDSLFREWRSWRHMSLYQLKKASAAIGNTRTTAETESPAAVLFDSKMTNNKNAI